MKYKTHNRHTIIVSILLAFLMGCASGMPDPTTDAPTGAAGAGQVVGNPHGTPNGLPDCGPPPAGWPASVTNAAGRTWTPVISLTPCDPAVGDGHGNPALCHWELPGETDQPLTNCYPSAFFEQYPAELPYAAKYTCPVVCPAP